MMIGACVQVMLSVFHVTIICNPLNYLVLIIPSSQMRFWTVSIYRGQRGGKETQV